ncbi:hypothetical protein TSMEX_003906 [Taenia solium]|eukprot:TsM_000871000 transcript=TsM_000871000 gene=TsM_000871000
MMEEPREKTRTTLKNKTLKEVEVEEEEELQFLPNVYARIEAEEVGAVIVATSPPSSSSPSPWSSSSSPSVTKEGDIVWRQ